MKAIVVGGGWAGLAAATYLSKLNHTVTLFESSPKLGGRAATIDDSDRPIDSHQHFMLGCCHETLAWFEMLGLPTHKLTKRNLLRLEMRSAQHQSISLHTPNVAAPMHLLWGIMRMKGLRLHERGTLFRLCAHLIRSNFRIEQDLPLEKWLRQNGQTKHLSHFFWQPLSLLLLNTPIKYASTQVLLNLLRRSFVKDRGDSDLLFIHPKLNQQLPQLAQQYIEKHSGQLCFKQTVSELIIHDNKITGVKVEGEIHNADHVILATPSWITANLCSNHKVLKDIAQRLSQFEYHPIHNICLRYSESTHLSSEMLGLINMNGHWLFDRRLHGQPGAMNIIIYGPGQHEKLDDATLIELISREIAQLFPHWPRPIDSRVIRKQCATLNCPPEIHALRPETNTPVAGLWLAGDYIRSDYPARLESAVKSGMQSAKAITSS